MHHTIFVWEQLHSLSQQFPKNKIISFFCSSALFLLNLPVKLTNFTGKTFLSKVFMRAFYLILFFPELFFYCFFFQNLIHSSQSLCLFVSISLYFFLSHLSNSNLVSLHPSSNNPACSNEATNLETKNKISRNVWMC